jgi:UDP-N-acetylmuramate--alanine ligase
MIVLTNIEEDHLDYYRDLAHIRETFQTYIGKLPPTGKLVLNADDPVSAFDLRSTVPTVRYGLGLAADYFAHVTGIADGRQHFAVTRSVAGRPQATAFSLALPGVYNVQNALAAIAAASELDVRPEVAAEAIADFRGLWRRFETVGEIDGIPVISDYGHHPSAVRLTLAGARQFYPNRRLVLAFQPHQRNRTRRLFREFVAAFDGADLLILPEIFDVAGRECAADRGISSGDLALATGERDAERGRRRDIVFSPNLAAAQEDVRRRLRPGDVLIVMGAGEAHTLAKNLVLAVPEMR